MLPLASQLLVAVDATTAYVPARRKVVLIDALARIAVCAFGNVRNGCARVPGFVSSPLGET